MKTVEERIENLSDEYLDRFAGGLSRINCGGVDCRECPMQTDSGCMFTMFYDEQDKRRARANEKTVATSTTELDSKVEELIKQCDILLKLLNIF